MHSWWQCVCWYWGWWWSLHACDAVTTLNCKGARDRGTWVDATEWCRQHGCLWASLWIHLGWLWLGHCCPPVHEQVEKTVLLPCMAPISNGEAFIPVWASGCRLSAVTIASSLMGGCGLSHERVEDGCKSTCVKFGGWKPDRTGDMVSLIQV